jgi:phospholipid:diacylglycerol acyltransferase
MFPSPALLCVDFYRNSAQSDTADEIPYVIDDTIEDVHSNIRNGVRLADGDGTVPLVSLGYMCARGWKTRERNPAGMQVVTREYPHKPAPLLSVANGISVSIRGGDESGDHVDILGRKDLLQDVVRIAVGGHWRQVVSQRIVSRIQDVANLVDRNIDDLNQ